MGGRGGGGVYSTICMYVRFQRVWFLSSFGPKKDLYFNHFALTV